MSSLFGTCVCRGVDASPLETASHEKCFTAPKETGGRGVGGSGWRGGRRVVKSIKRELGRLLKRFVARNLNKEIQSHILATRFSMHPIGTKELWT